MAQGVPPLPTRRAPERFALVALLLFSLAGAGFLLYLTPMGMGITPDSVVFIDASRNVLMGRGLMVTLGDGLEPLAHHPPLYPALLAGLGTVVQDPVAGARLLSAELLAANMFLIGILAGRGARHPSLASPLAAILYLGTSATLARHLYAETEALFLFFCLSALLLMWAHLIEPSVVRLAPSAVAAALAFLTRYIGGALVAALVVAVVLQPTRPWQQRLAEACVVLGLGTGPMALWLLRNATSTGSATNRALVFHPLRIEQLQRAAHTVLDWLLPTGWVSGRPELWVPLAGVVVALLGLALWRQQRRSGLGIKARVMLIFVACYGVLLLLSLSFFDAHTPLDGRILSPVLAAGIVLVTSTVDRALREESIRPRIRAVIAVACVLLVVAHSFRGISRALPVRQDGLGFAARGWRDSALLAQTAELTPERPIYSNGPDVLLYHLGRPAHWLPMPENPSVARPNAEYEREMALMDERLCGQGGVLVYWRLVTWRGYLPSEEYLVERLGLTPTFENTDGAIYRCSEPARLP